MTETLSQKRNHAVLQTARSLWHLASVVLVTIWGFLAWPLPMPGLLYGFGALIFAVLLWALFLSPKPVLKADRFAQSMIELLLLAAAVAAMLELGVHWLLAAAFGVAGAAIGFISGSRA